MKYANPKLPKCVCRNIERDITELVDNARLQVFSRCKYNSTDHIQLAVYGHCYEAICRYLFLDASLEDDEVVALLNRGKGLQIVTNHAASWLAIALREKYPPRDKM